MNLTPVLLGFVLVLFRTSALCAVAPIFSARAVPGRVRMGLSLVLAFVAFSCAGWPRFGGDSIPRLAGAAAIEALLGLAAGISARLALDAAYGAGHLMADAMGLSYGSTLDPVHGTEVPALSELTGIAAAGALVVSGGVRELIAWLCRSVVRTPPGTVSNVGGLMADVVQQAVGSIALAVRMGFPVLVAVLLGHVGLGLLGRVAPQLNLTNIGFSVSILAGFGALYTVTPALAEMTCHAVRAALLGMP